MESMRAESSTRASLESSDTGASATAALSLWAGSQPDMMATAMIPTITPIRLMAPTDTTTAIDERGSTGETHPPGPSVLWRAEK